MKFYKCALELLRKSNLEPDIVYEKTDVLYRFYGITKSNEKFIVQVKKSGKENKYLMSVFPHK